MCGITGFVNNSNEKADLGILDRMNRAILHRGPDEDGYYLKDNVAMAMRRLAIIDLAGGQQPISNGDGTKWIVYNGEVYNYQELREGLLGRGHKLQTSSDTEAVVHLYDEFGIDCLQHLRGMFAFAIWDETDRSLFLARDRVGKKPLLYSLLPDGGIVFGSEFTALLEHPGVSREIDHEAIDSYMSYLCVPAPMTAFKNIRKLEPGHWLRWKDGKIKMNRYWRPDFSSKIKISEQEAIEETTRILRESTRLRMISEVPLGAFLSGGVDSSAVVALMAQESSQRIKTFSIGFEEQDFSELKYAKRVAEHVGAEYNEFIVKPNAIEILPTLVEHYGEPFADPSAIPTYYVSRETRKFVTVALNGDGGDESFAGYERHVAMRFANAYKSLPSPLRTKLIEPATSWVPTPVNFRNRLTRVQRFLRSASRESDDRYFRWLSAFDPEAKSELYTNEFKRLSGANRPAQLLTPYFENVNGTGSIDASLMADLMHYLPNDLLVKVDIASMANSLEARSPFLDHKLIEFAASLPENLKQRGFGTKSLLKKVAANLVPKDVIYRRKMGFGVPLRNWFRSDLREFAWSTLESERHRKRELFRPGVVAQILSEHENEVTDHSFKILALINLELWFRRFID